MDSDKTAQLASTIDKGLENKFGTGHSNYVEVPLGFSFSSRYVVESKIAEGGMGVVYAALDTQLRRKVAIKLLKRNLIKDKSAITKLIKEAQVSMILTHPGIMRLINFEQDGPYAYLLMEFVEGKNLREIAASSPDRKLSSEYVATVGYAICDALSYAHDKKNVIHRDIKPANIVVGETADSAKLLDFGIARVLAPGSAKRPPVAGTLSYIAPEIFKGVMPDPRADIYALGVTLYELLAGFNPCSGNSAQEIIESHMDKKPPSLNGVDKELSSIIFQCIEKMPNARFQSAGELRGAFARYLDIDEKVKLGRIRKKLDREKQDVDHKLRKMEREKEKLEARQDRLRREITKKTLQQQHRGGVAGDQELLGTLGELDGQKFVPLIAVSLLAGVFAAFLRYLVIDGRVIEFESVGAYNAFATMLAVGVMVALPAYYKQQSRFVVPFILGMALGGVGYLWQEAYMAYAFENDIWGEDNFTMYVSVCASLAVGAGVVKVGEVDVMRLLVTVSVGCLAGLAVIFLPYIEFAETTLGLEDTRACYFYFPFMATMIWTAIEMAESWLNDD